MHILVPLMAADTFKSRGGYTRAILGYCHSLVKVGVKPLIVDFGLKKSLNWWNVRTKTLNDDEIVLDCLTIPHPSRVPRRHFQKDVIEELRSYDPQLVLIEGNRESGYTGMPLARSLKLPAVLRTHSIRGLWAKQIAKYTMPINPKKAVQELVTSVFSQSRTIYDSLTADYSLTLNSFEEQYLKRFRATATTIPPTYVATVNKKLANWNNDAELIDGKYVITMLYPREWDSIRQIIGLKLIHYMSKKNSALKFVIIGATPKDFQEYLGSKPQPNVIFLNELNDATFYNLIQNASIVLLPLVWLTGTSMRLVEALYFGKPVITTSAVASRLSTFINGKHCIIDDNFKNYPEHVNKILDDEHMRCELSKNARNYFDTNLGYEKIGLRHLTVFDSLLSI